ncbi:MAG: response regulator [Desulfobacterales bacterium]|nr:response regulator [Desulfobacterales bacterium]
MKTILILDRYPNMLEAFERFLSQENYRVLTTDTLDEAFGIINVVKVDLMIMDTGKNSEELILKTEKIIREKNLTLPILLTATYSDTLTEKAAKKLRAADIILKPFDPKDIKRIIRELIDKNNLN